MLGARRNRPWGREGSENSELLGNLLLDTLGKIEALQLTHGRIAEREFMCGKEIKTFLCGKFFRKLFSFGPGINASKRCYSLPVYMKMSFRRKII
jgi:hypothetical protein